jgi:putative methyltransferase (TIGR04325 family)
LPLDLAEFEIEQIMTWKDYMESIMPPVALQSFRSIQDRIRTPTNSLTYAPGGWNTELPADAVGNNQLELAEASYRKWGPIFSHLRRRPLSGTVGLLEDTANNPSKRIQRHNAYLAFAYVLALTAHRSSLPRVLDYGGNLGHYYWVGRVLLPDYSVDYHCKELPEIVEKGKQLIPEITWHVTDSCLDQPFDLLTFSAVLPYIADWQNLLRRAAASTRRFLYIAMLPTVEAVPAYVAIQKYRGATMLYQVLNKQDVTEFVHSTGLRLVQEFWFGQHLRIRSAPEQPSYCGWLFEKVSR